MKATPNSHLSRAALSGATIAIALLIMSVSGVLAAPLQTPPVNDDFSGAIDITLASPYPTVYTDHSVLDYTQATPVNTGDPTTDPPLTGCGLSGTGLNTVWFKYTATTNAELHVDTFTTGWDTVLSVWTGTEGNLTAVNCNDDTNGIQSEVRFPVSTGTTYYIEVANFTAPSAGLSAQVTTDLFLHFSYRVKPGTSNAPSIPVLKLPLNGGLVTTLTPRMDWANTALKTGTYFWKYQVKLATNSTFTVGLSTFDIFGLTNSEYTPLSDLNSNTRYYWKVSACNAYGYCSGYSAPWSFRVTILPPVLDLPTDAWASDGLRPTFDWEDVTGAASYNVQVAKVDTFTSGIYMNATVPTNSIYTPVADLPAGMTLYWRVRANAAAPNFGPSGWSEVRSFITPKPPSTPLPVSPANNSLTYNYQPTFDWTNSTVPPGGLAFDHYEFQIATDIGFGSIVEDFDTTPPGNVTVSSHQVAAPLTPNTKYFWHVRAWDAFGNHSAWSASWAVRAAMLAPNLIAPPDGPAVDHRRPTFDWSDATGISLTNGYTLQASKVSNFSILALNVSVTPSDYTPTVDLTASTNYWWRVRANGPNGPSVWTSAWQFSTPNPPSIPVLVSPLNNALSTVLQPTFDWNNVTVPLGTTFDHYQFQIATDIGFGSIVESYDTIPLGDVTVSSHQVASPLTPNTKYFWHVRSWDTGSNYSSWSATWALREAMDPPTLLLPLDGTAFDTLKPAFDWSDVTGISATNGYTLQVSKLTNFSSLSLNVNVTPSNYTPVTNLPGGSLLYWRVRANGANGPSAWASYLSFSTPNGPPTLSTPTNGAVVTNYNPTLDWVTPTLAGGTTFTNYEVEVATGSGFGGTVVETDTSNATVGNSFYQVVGTLNTDAIYYWHVRFNYTDASLGSHTTAWSTTFSFKTSITAPVLSLPADGTNPQSDLTPTFDWGNVTNAASYMIQVSSSPTFATTVINTTVSGPTNSTYTPGVPLAGGTLYYWRVRANAVVGHYGPSGWSTVFTFTTP